MRALLCIMIVLSIVSCKTRQKISQTEKNIVHDTVVQHQVHVDTVIKTKVVEKTRPVTNRVVINKPCDSTGVLRAFNYQLGSGSNAVSLKTQNGKLVFDYHLDSIMNQLENRYRSRYLSDSLMMAKTIERLKTHQKKIVHTVWPWWLYGVIAVGAISIGLNIYQKIKVV